MKEAVFQPDLWKSMAICVLWTKWMHDGGDNNVLFLFACVISDTTESAQNSCG